MRNRGSIPTVFLDADTMKPEDLDLSLLECSTSSLRLYATTSREQLIDHTKDAVCVITNKVHLGREFFEARPTVRLICIIATGTNNVDLEAAQAHDVSVVNCRGYSTQSVAQHTLMLILMMLRSSQSYQRQIQGGDWSHSKLFCLLNDSIRETTGLTLGIIGFGDIGRAVQALAQAFDFRVVISERVGCTPRSGRVRFEEVIEQADILTLHCPLTSETRQMIDAQRLTKMKRGALLVNTARGDLIDEQALADALFSGRLGGAALDVLSEEPPSEEHPLIALNPPNLILTPHIAWASHQARQQAVDQTVENIIAWRSGNSVRIIV